MKLIGQGYYYNVYDLGNGRVRKIPISQLAQVAKLFVWYFHSPATLFREIMRAPYSKKARAVEYDNAEKISVSAPEIFGNPSFNGWIYDQDKVTTLGNLLRQIPLESFLEYCMQYTEVVHSLWRKGVGDMIFNFTLNAGIDQKGKLYLVDTNELTLDKEVMRKEIASKRFLRASSFKRLPEEYKEPVRNIFEKEFSLEKFEALWRADVS